MTKATPHNRPSGFTSQLIRSCGLWVSSLAALLVLLVLPACQEQKTGGPVRLRPGAYTVLFNTGEIEIPARLRITEDYKWCFHNWNETIVLDSVVLSDSMFRIKMPLFNTALEGRILTDSTFEGVWKDFSRDADYSINFKGHHTAISNITCEPEIEDSGNKSVYDVTFSPESAEDISKAVGEFYRKNNKLVGTFMTESGDYRYLQGYHTGSSLELSSFDGAHLFYFCANVANDSLTDGKFYSGKHWQEDWEGRLNAGARLRDPDSLTYVTKQEESFRFYAFDQEQDSVLFDTAFFRNKVTIVQIFGSWCPNCTDESLFMKELYSRHQHQGLEIVPVAFERTSDFQISKNAVLNQFRELGLQYSPYFGGFGGKGNAAKVFSQLNTISSFPTTIFIDKSGKVRKIHTGFYGPGTGEHYQKNTAELSAFVEELLAEPGAANIK